MQSQKKNCHLCRTLPADAADRAQDVFIINVYVCMYYKGRSGIVAIGPTAKLWLSHIRKR